MFCIIGVYAVNTSVIDVWIMLIMGCVGYMLRKFGYDPAPLVLGLVMAPILEQSLRQSLIMSNGNYLIFVERPIALGLVLVAVLLLTLSAVSSLAGARTGVAGSPPLKGYPKAPEEAGERKSQPRTRGRVEACLSSRVLLNLWHDGSCATCWRWSCLEAEQRLAMQKPASRGVGNR